MSTVTCNVAEYKPPSYAYVGFFCCVHQIMLYSFLCCFWLLCWSTVTCNAAEYKPPSYAYIGFFCCVHQIMLYSFLCCFWLLCWPSGKVWVWKAWESLSQVVPVTYKLVLLGMIGSTPGLGLAQGQNTVTGRDRRFDLYLLPQCVSMCRCLSKEYLRYALLLGQQAAKK